MSKTTDIVAKLWSFCNILRDDGVTYHQYVTELTFLLFLKMAKETDTESMILEGYRWDDLIAEDGLERLNFYKKLLLELQTTARGRVQQIFANAQTFIRQPKNLDTLVTNIDSLDWYDAKEEADGLGDLYEGLLEKNANEKKSGAGQYFTPRELIAAIIACVKPQPGEIIQDPACGTGGFLIAADRYIKKNTDDMIELEEQLVLFQQREAFHGMELVPDTHRLALMNAIIHDINGPITLGDTLTSVGAELPKADVILTNPPFGTKKGGGKPSRDDFTFDTSNKQLAFLQHIYRGLKTEGRAAVVLPDNVLFEEGMGSKIREDLLGKCNLHTILRLPTGIFYAQGVKTNVLFFTRGKKDTGQTKEVWFFDMRTNMPKFGKRTPFTRAHFKDFEKVYGNDPHGKSKRKDQGEEGRFRCFSLEEIKKRNWNLDISWLRDDSIERAEDLPEPEEITKELLGHARLVTEKLELLSKLLENESAK